MANNLYNTMYNPDVLSCIAKLSLLNLTVISVGPA